MNVDAIRDVTLDLIDEWGLRTPSWSSLLEGDGGQLALLSLSTPTDLRSQTRRNLAKKLVDPVYEQIVERWPSLHRLAVNVLGPSASIRPHIESHMPVYRWHLPVQTNSEAVVTVDGRPRHHPYGVPFVIDVHQIHSAVNHGTTPRVHLIWDVPR